MTIYRIDEVFGRPSPQPGDSHVQVLRFLAWSKALVYQAVWPSLQRRQDFHIQ